MSLIRDLIHAGGTGGLNWHVHAHYSRERWQPTVQLIEQFFFRGSNLGLNIGDQCYLTIQLLGTYPRGKDQSEYD